MHISDNKGVYYTKEDIQKDVFFYWWARMQPIRTLADEISLHVRIDPTNLPPLYQRISLKLNQLRTLKMSFYEITDKLEVHITTVLQAHYFSEA